ncbi:class I SAM-dependent DNA methyltransferase [Microlunatus flavus]|uniref:Methyltransferase domain-containing protein n=1 Tax=Microlunatus flavus TaxID=1036181 RepID=A0A1H9GE06_9ACTN|nr:class I SAM-dependent methyltransferase [Microlunatus flavus]SEQ48263.1 Methyltransferase domain-containing protein [Microlunatus flavus]
MTSPSTSSDVWDARTAEAYDADNVGMSAPEVLGPTLDRLVALAEGGPVLELAIGTGRVAVPLAARGLAVSGIELSQPMVDQLRAKAGPDEIPVVVGDMARVRVPGAFALVYLVFNTISNLLEQDEQVACFANAAAHLRPGGRFVVELGVPDLRRLAPGRDATIFETGADRIGLDTYDVVTQRMVSHHFRFAEDAGTTQAALFRSRHRYAWPAELDLMARLAGLELEHRWAGWSGEPFTAESESHVSVYRLPA